MARNLLRAGHRLTMYNRTRARAEPLLQDGAALADSPAEAVRDVDAVDQHAGRGPGRSEQAAQAFARYPGAAARSTSA